MTGMNAKPIFNTLGDNTMHIYDSQKKANNPNIITTQKGSFNMYVLCLISISYHWYYNDIFC